MGLTCPQCKENFTSMIDLISHFRSENHRKRFQKNTIFVSHIPQSVVLNDLIEFFKIYGTVLKYRVVGNNQNNVIIEFKNMSSVEMLTSKTIRINGTKLNIIDLYYSDCTAEKIEQLSYENVRTVFDNNSSFDSQLAAFLNKISLNDKDVQIYYKPVCQEVNEVFQSIFPKCKTYRFGSTVVGLGFKNSDLDLFLNTGIPIVEENSTIVGPHVISKDTLFSVVKNIMSDNPHIFAKFHLIPRARTPVIKFIHRKTNIPCDISFKSKIGVYNSDLIKFYLSIDPRFRPLMMIIKYWMYTCQFRSHVGITGYALTLLFIFYLQQIKLVPPVIELQTRCAIVVTIKEWQVNFNKNLSWFQVEDNHRNKSIPQLLEGFFEFYANYDFKNNVICPGDGHSCDKNLFINIEDLPESMQRYKKYLKETECSLAFWVVKPMCLQDPIELNVNLTKNIYYEHLQKFQLFCAIAFRIVQNTSINSYQNLLKHLFNSTRNVETDKQEIKEQGTTFSIYLPKFLEISHSTEAILKKNLFIKNNWFDLTFGIIKQYLQEVLNFETKINGIEKEIDQEKLRFKENGISENQNEIVLHCKGIYCLWLNREYYEINDPAINPLQNEIDISKKILKKIVLKNNNETTIINFDCHFVKMKKPNTHILLTLVDKGCSSKLFSALEHHLQHKMISVVNKTLKFMRHNSNLHLNGM